MARKRTAFILSTLILVSTLSQTWAAEKNPKAQLQEIMVLYTGDVQGNVEPCG